MKCYAPWGYLIVDVNGDVHPCCFYYKPLGNLYKNSIEEIWNGEGYLGWRLALRAGIPQECVDCSIKVTFPIIEPSLSTPFFYDNYFLNRREFDEARLQLSSRPIFYNITTSTSCNLKCSFCSQNKYRKEEVAPLSENIISNLKEYFRYAHILSWCGGETLIQEPFLDFLEENNFKVYPNMCLEVTTNGTLLNTMILDKLNKFKKTFLVISIDGGSKYIYEKLRVGADWTRVLNNLGMIKEYENIYPTIQYTVMKSNILDILNAVILFRTFNIPVVFSPVVGENLVDENIFWYPDLLRGINWVDTIDTAIGISYGETRNSLIMIRSKLIKENKLWGGGIK